MHRLHVSGTSSVCLVRKEKVTSVEDGAHLQQLMPLSEA